MTFAFLSMLSVFIRENEYLESWNSLSLSPFCLVDAGDSGKQRVAGKYYTWATWTVTLLDTRRRQLKGGKNLLKMAAPKRRYNCWPGCCKVKKTLFLGGCAPIWQFRSSLMKYNHWPGSCKLNRGWNEWNEITMEKYKGTSKMCPRWLLLKFAPVALASCPRHKSLAAVSYSLSLPLLPL